MFLPKRVAGTFPREASWCSTFSSWAQRGKTSATSLGSEPWWSPSWPQFSSCSASGASPYIQPSSTSLLPRLRWTCFTSCPSWAKTWFWQQPFWSPKTTLCRLNKTQTLKADILPPAWSTLNGHLCGA